MAYQPVQERSPVAAESLPLSVAVSRCGREIDKPGVSSSSIDGGFRQIAPSRCSVQNTPVSGSGRSATTHQLRVWIICQCQ
ncbi:MAG TPA: hypothetical protein DCE55_12475 [Planctomycetaceae bacterium]|nr:hypothetical protein [Planctomycetaceae bacterium]